MHKILKVVATAAVLALSAQPASAQMLLQMFQGVCLNAEATVEAQTASAKAAGFVRVPKSFATSFPTEFAKDVVLLWKVRDLAVDIAILGSINPSASPLGSDIDGSVCAIMSMPKEPSQTKALQTILGVTPQIEDGQTVFLYSDERGKRTGVNPDRTLAVARLIEAGTLRFAMVVDAKDEDFEGTMVLLLIPRASRLSALPADTPGG